MSPEIFTTAVLSLTSYRPVGGKLSIHRLAGITPVPPGAVMHGGPGLLDSAGESICHAVSADPVLSEPQQGGLRTLARVKIEATEYTEPSD